MTCGACSRQNREGAKFCTECGAALTAACPSCGSNTGPDEKFCGECGAALADRAPRRTPSPEPFTVSAERKHITVLFADVAGSMDLQERLDAEVWAEIMGRFVAILAEGVRRYGGTVDKFTGDGIMALFGAPVAQEDHARRACHAAWHLTRAIGAYSEELRTQNGVELHVRLGLNSGEVVVGRVGDDMTLDPTALGHTVGLAQRMETMAEPGTVYLTGATADLVTGYFGLRDLGPKEVKGAHRLVSVFELTGPGPFRTPLEVATGRGLSRFVGREAEMAILHAALTEVARGHGRAVGLVGEPGVGKSRLCHEFAEHCRAAGATVSVARALAHARSVPFLPILEMVRSDFGINEQDGAVEARAKVAATIGDLYPQGDEALPLLHDFLGVADPAQPAPLIDAEARQAQLFRTLSRLRHARGARSPAVIVLEDLHWLDPGSLAFAENLIDTVPEAGVLVVMTFRPEYRPPWAHRPFYAQLPLAPLDEPTSDALVRDLLGRHPSLEHVAALIKERTGGNPFFIEEVIRGLDDERSLEGERGGYRLRRTIDEVAIPGTVKAVLAARIDRLSDRDKSLLQTAAVIGRRFSRRVVRAVSELAHPDLDDALQTLLETGLIYKPAADGDGEFAFKHALVEDVAYGLQLSARRARVHAAVARTLPELEPDRQEERAALIAHHYEAAGLPSEAAGWNATAARWSAVNDPVEAARRWRRVRALTDQLGLSETTTDLAVQSRLELLGAHWRLGSASEEAGVPFEEEAATIFGELDRIADVTGLDGVKVFGRLAYGAVQQLGFGVREGNALCVDAVAIADATGDRTLQTVARMAAWSVFLLGDVRRAATMANEMAEIMGDDRKVARGMVVLSPYGWARLQVAHFGAYCGRLDDGLSALDAVIELLEEEGDRECWAWAHRHWAVFADLAGVSPRDAAWHAQQSLAWADEAGGAWSRIFNREGMATSHVQRGEWTPAVQLVDEAIGMISARRIAQAELPLLLCIKSRAQLGLDDPAAARRSSEEAVVAAVRAGTRFYEAQARHQLALAVMAAPISADEPVAAAHPDWAATATAQLDQALHIVDALGICAYTPHIRRTRSTLARLLGDREAYEEELTLALRLFLDVGATGHAGRVEAELSASAR